MIEKNLLRTLVLELLGRVDHEQMNHVINEVEKLVVDRALFPSEDDCERRGINYRPYREKQLSPIDRLTLSEIIWDLIQ